MIILRDPNNIDHLEVFTTLSKLCKANRWANYNTVREKKFPFVYKGRRFDKVSMKDENKEPVIGKFYRCRKSGAFIGNAQYTDHPRIGKVFIQYRNGEAFPIYPDKWKPVNETDK